MDKFEDIVLGKIMQSRKENTADCTHVRLLCNQVHRQNGRGQGLGVGKWKVVLSAARENEKV